MPGVKCTHLGLLVVRQEETGLDEHAAVLAADPGAHAARAGRAVVADHVRGRRADEAALDAAAEHVAWRRDDVVRAHVGQQLRQDVAQLDVVEVALLDALLRHAVRRVAQQVRLCNNNEDALLAPSRFQLKRRGPARWGCGVGEEGPQPGGSLEQKGAGLPQRRHMHDYNRPPGL